MTRTLSGTPVWSPGGRSFLVRGFNWCKYLFDCSLYYLYGYGQGML